MENVSASRRRTNVAAHWPHQIGSRTYNPLRLITRRNLLKMPTVVNQRLCVEIPEMGIKRTITSCRRPRERGHLETRERCGHWPAQTFAIVSKEVGTLRRVRCGSHLS